MCLVPGGQQQGAGDAGNGSWARSGRPKGAFLLNHTMAGIMARAASGRQGNATTTSSVTGPSPSYTGG